MVEAEPRLALARMIESALEGPDSEGYDEWDADAVPTTRHQDDALFCAAFNYADTFFHQRSHGDEDFDGKEWAKGESGLREIVEALRGDQAKGLNDTLVAYARLGPLRANS